MKAGDVVQARLLGSPRWSTVRLVRLGSRRFTVVNRDHSFFFVHYDDVRALRPKARTP